MASLCKGQVTVTTDVLVKLSSLQNEDKIKALWDIPRPKRVCNSQTLPEITTKYILCPEGRSEMKEATWLNPISKCKQISIYFYKSFLLVTFCLWSITYLFSFKKLFYCSITVLCIFSPPVPPTPAKPTSLPCFHPLLGFVYMSFIVVPENPSTHCPPPTSGYCQLILNFNDSGYTFFAFFFC